MHPADAVAQARLWCTAELRMQLTKRQIADAVGSGRLLRVRRGFFVVSPCHPDVERAARLHGRLDCVSLLSVCGVFVRDRGELHLQVEPGTTAPPPARGAVRHWRRSGLPPSALTTDVVDALVQACRCQDELAALATLDSAWHGGVVDEHALAQVIAALPGRFRRLRAQLDRRSEAGTETILRVSLRRRGYRVEVQVAIDGVGRVDLLIDGWLIVECDSEAHHSGWAAQRRDRRRDQAAAARGYTTLRPIAEDILWHTDVVVAGIVGLIVARTGSDVHNLADPRTPVRL